MKQFKITAILRHVLWSLLALLLAQTSWAAVSTTGALSGALTPAGSLISNVATISYSVGGVMQPPSNSTIATVKVGEIINPVMTCQTPLFAVNNPSSNDAVTYGLTNAGNGTQIFSMGRVNQLFPTAPNYVPQNSVAYDPTKVSPTGAMFLESNGVAGLQLGVGGDVQYIPGVNDPVVAAGITQQVYVLSDTPLVAFNAQGQVMLTATSKTAGAASAVIGTHLLDTVSGVSVSAVVVTTNGAASAVCAYQASGLGFVMNKTVASIVDPFGGAVIMPGSIMTYQISVTLSGVGTAVGLVVTDPIPANTTYVANSITVNGVAKTDVLDADNAQFSTLVVGAVPANTVYVALGNMTAPVASVVTFRVTVN